MAKGMARIDELAQTEAEDDVDTSQAYRTWTEAKKDKDAVASVLEKKKELNREIKKWGVENLGVSDLSFGSVQTTQDPEKKARAVYYIWKSDGGKDRTGAYFRYREGDDVPVWITKLKPSWRDWCYPDGKSLTPEMKGKYTGREGKTSYKSLEDL